MRHWLTCSMLLAAGCGPQPGLQADPRVPAASTAVAPAVGSQMAAIGTRGDERVFSDPTLKVAEPDFQGNDGLPTDRLRTTVGDVEQLRRPDGRERARQRLLADYHAEGYMDAQVSTAWMTVSEKEDALASMFMVSEGEQYFVGEVRFAGDPAWNAADEKDIDALLRSHPGGVVDRSLLEEAVVRLLDASTRNGYACPDITPVPAKHGNWIDFRIDASKGPLCSAGEIHFTGARKVPEERLNEVFGVREGQSLQGVSIEGARAALAGLDGITAVQVARSCHTETGLVDFEVRITERAPPPAPPPPAESPETPESPE